MITWQINSINDNSSTNFQTNLATLNFLQEAIKSESFYDGCCAYLEKGYIDKGFKESNHSLNGTLRIGGQDHFYLETQCCIAIPMNEHNEIEIISSTQSPNELQV